MMTAVKRRFLAMPLWWNLGTKAVARKNPFANLMSDPCPDSIVARRSTVKGALRSTISSNDGADKPPEGATVVKMDPTVIDESFGRDHMEEASQAFQALLIVNGEYLPSRPVLVRPHPTEARCCKKGCDHLRLKATEVLGGKVRSAAKVMADRDRLSGREITARSDLAFIENAAFARQFGAHYHDSDAARATFASSIEHPPPSTMLSVANVRKDVLVLIGGAKSPGRGRLVKLKQVLESHLKVTTSKGSIGTRILWA